MKSFLLGLSPIMFVAIAFCQPAATGAEDTPASDTAKKTDRAALEEKFRKTMTNVKLIGRFSIVGQKDGKLSTEEYTIEKVTKSKGDDWDFSVRIKYGNHNVRVPLRLPVKWAGDTPVISVTDLKVPFIGTYTARVTIYNGKYAGTWSGKDHGGHLFGVIVPNKPEKE